MVDTFLRLWDADDAQSLQVASVENVDLAPQFGGTPPGGCPTG
ncbi:hypothetical protein [Plantibacter flavus]|nr:hypothetical protein [Plantibacter flavus]